MESYYNQLAKKIKEIDSKDLKRMDEEIRKIDFDYQISVDEYIQKVGKKIMDIKEKINELERQLNELKASLKEEAKEERPITERVKTFEDALDILGEEHLFVRSYREWMMVRIHRQNDIDAYLKLRIITAALNEGWKPQFTEDEYRYYPFYQLYTQAEYDALPDNGKQDLVLFGGGKGFCGLAGANSSFAWSGSSSSISSRLCYKNAVLAKYSAKQFVDIWADYFLSRK